MKHLVKTTILLFISINSLGQFNPGSNLYILSPMTINPSFAGERGALNIMSLYSQKWVGIEGAPKQLIFSMDAPVSDNKLGLGLSFVSDRVGVVNENQFISNYSYKISMARGQLSFGLGAGLILTNTNFSDLVVLDPGDEIYLNDSRVFLVPNFSFGFFYNSDKFFAGLAIPKLLGYGYDYTKNKHVLENNFRNYSYLVNSGLRLKISQSVGFYPSVMLRYSMIPDNARFQYDINAQLSLLDKFWLGASYRNARSVSGILQFQANEQIRIGYIYDFEISKLGNYSSGSHFIMLSYVFKYKVDAVNPLIF